MISSIKEKDLSGDRSMAEAVDRRSMLGGVLAHLWDRRHFQAHEGREHKDSHTQLSFLLHLLHCMRLLAANREDDGSSEITEQHGDLSSSDITKGNDHSLR